MLERDLEMGKSIRRSTHRMDRQSAESLNRGNYWLLLSVNFFPLSLFTPRPTFQACFRVLSASVPLSSSLFMPLTFFLSLPVCLLFAFLKLLSHAFSSWWGNQWEKDDTAEYVSTDRDTEHSARSRCSWCCITPSRGSLSADIEFDPV